MTKVNQEKLTRALRNEMIDIIEVRKMLADELNTLAVVTLPTLGAFDASLIASESNATAKLAAQQAEAQANVDIIRSVFSKLGIAEEIKTCCHCHKNFAGSGKTCSTCYEPTEY